MASSLPISKGGWKTILFVSLPCAPLQTGSSITEDSGKEHWESVSNLRQTASGDENIDISQPLSAEPNMNTEHISGPSGFSLQPLSPPEDKPDNTSSARAAPEAMEARSGLRHWRQTAQVQTLALLLTGCIILDKLLPLSVPQLPHI